MPPIAKDKRYTVRDYRSWDDDGRYELIDGEVYAMASPSLEHQIIVGNVFRQLDTFLIGKPCRTVVAPFDVYISGDAEEDDTVFQPDVLVVCDRTKITSRGVVGAPDIVVEVLSPTTAEKDTILKLHRYQREGVKEYWVVSVDSRTIYRHVLTGRGYDVTVFTNGAMPSERLRGFNLDVDAVFNELNGLYPEV